ncbi:Eco57I restriction-modification methylase domain-containing protein [Corynebacterium sp. sy039]|uniref:Eco57I restriction-modification methylase domain-containing protein n=1 Tax=Corynebacterium sp. sy039 TaxID=2599641 RepID=UPI0011B51975|nr:N-6 DNA methylase [Corynebacterium sp. sy039]QDZ42448.1 N-6 DNA methylase [Corynebacterium sp. sy039]
MTAPHLLTIARIYQATLKSPSLDEAFQSWLKDVENVRGSLERKKKMSQSQLECLLPGESITDVNRFVFSIESYMCLHALEVIENVDNRITFSGEVESIIIHARNKRKLFLSACPESLQEISLMAKEFYNSRERSFRSPIFDEFQEMRMSLLPREIRHSIGAFYTPIWLANHVLKESGYDCHNEDFWKKTLLDPSAGSGVFLMAAADQLRYAVQEQIITEKIAVDTILQCFFAIEVELVPCMQIIANICLALEVFIRKTSNKLICLNNNVINADALGKIESIQPVDMVVGNPPWVNWEYMPDQFRKKHANRWIELGIFEREGKQLAFSKEDISALFVAHSVDRYLKPQGLLSFIVPESLLKSTKNHSGFRKFSVGIFPQPYRIDLVEDFVDVKPFEGVANRTIVIYGSNGKETEYPLPYRIWKKISHKSRSCISNDYPIDGVRKDLMAQPSNIQDLTSAWSTGTREQLNIFRQLEGTNSYRGRTGLFTGGANAVFHLSAKSPAVANSIHVENITERAKRTAPQITAELETEFIYPFLRGRDLRQWSSEVEVLTLLPHTTLTRMQPVSEETMHNVAPKTLKYLNSFRGVLDERRGFSSWEKPFLEIGFYACQRVGDYTFSDWKVSWKYISKNFTTDIIGPVSVFGLDTKPVIPNEKIMFVSCESKDEAFYLGGIFASALIRTQVESRMVSTQVSPGIIAGLNIPLFDKTNTLHLTISDLCSAAYDYANHGIYPSELLMELEVEVGKLWNIPETVALDINSGNQLNL